MFLKELGKSLIEDFTINDANPHAISLIKKNLKANKIPLKKVKLTKLTADQLLAQGRMYDYIDIDPFGSPNPFLDLSCKHIRNEGILAVTATDTAPLCGARPEACERKYWSKPSRTAPMHEFAVRILIRKVQLIAAQYERAAMPILSVAMQHYVRVWFVMKRGKKKIDALLAQHGEVEGKGPFWLGSLHEEGLAKKMYPLVPKDLQNMLTTLDAESKIHSIGLYDIHELSSELRIGEIPPFAKVMDAIKESGKQASRTIFCDTGIRTTATKEEMKRIIKKLVQ